MKIPFNAVNHGRLDVLKYALEYTNDNGRVMLPSMSGLVMQSVRYDHREILEYSKQKENLMKENQRLIDENKYLKSR